MAEIITSPLNTQPLSNPKENPFRLDFYGGLHLGFPTSISDGGNGKQAGFNLYDCNNSRDCFGFGLQFNWDFNSGNDFYKETNHFDGLLTFSRLQQTGRAYDANGKKTVQVLSGNNLYVGMGTLDEASSFEIGTSLFFETLVLRPFGSFPAFAVSAEADLLNSMPTDSGREDIPLTSLKGGFTFRGVLAEKTVTPPPEGLNNNEKAFFVLSQAHRFARTWVTTETLQSPSSNVQDYADQIGLLDKNGGGTSKRTEGMAPLLLLSGLGAASDDGNRLNLILKANGKGELGLMMGAEAAVSLAFFLGSFQDNSSSMLTQGFAGALELADLIPAAGLHLFYTDRHNRPAETNQTAARNLFLVQSLVRSLVFTGGWFAKETKVGEALLLAGQQKIVSMSLAPDPAESGFADRTSSNLFVMEFNTNGGRYFGLQQNKYLPSANGYTSMKLLMQSSPVASSAVQNKIDSATARNATTDSAKGMLAAGGGGYLDLHYGSLSAGLHSLMIYGDGLQPIPGVGLEEQLLFSFPTSDKPNALRIEAGIKASEDYTSKGFQLGVAPILGARY